MALGPDLAAHLARVARYNERPEAPTAWRLEVHVSPDFLEGYRVDAWVNTACPRIAIEDVLQYKKPLLTPPEFEIVVGERAWEDYAFDEIRA